MNNSNPEKSTNLENDLFYQLPIVGPSNGNSNKRIYKPTRGQKGYETIESILLTEPRIEAIRRELKALLQVIDLEINGQTIEIDGFRLRQNSHWTGYSTSLSDIFWHLSSVCNFSCEFCYEKGNPEGFPIQNTPRMASPEEISTRLKYYDPQKKQGLFTLRTAINEPFANKNALKYLHLMREKAPNELISFVTNGAYLSEEVVKALGKLQPLFFNLSIYSTDPNIRRNTLRDFRGLKAVEAVNYLARYEVPYMTNLVMWPSIPLEDMERTIAFMSKHKAVVLRICLGGYSKYLEGNWEPFDTKKYWSTVVEYVEDIRDKYDIPILIEPNSFIRKDTEAFVDGVIRYSPAHLKGIKRGDLIVKVNDKDVKSRMQLISALRRNSDKTPMASKPPGLLSLETSKESSKHPEVILTIKRDSKIFQVSLNRYDPEAMQFYPYNKIVHFNDFMFGLIITDTLKYSTLLNVRRIIEKNKAKSVLLLTSEMIKPILDYMLKKTNAFHGFDVHIRVAKNNYFGGSINVGDLLVVQDFIEAIQTFIEAEDKEVDLVLIPSSPFASSPWKRDLTGRPCMDIERKVNIKVRQIPTNSITF